MKYLKISVLFLFAAVLVLPFLYTSSVEGQSATEALTTDMDARTDDLWNGTGIKGTTVFDPPVAGDFVNNKAIFEEREDIDEGLGPVYNAQACVECHQSPDTGAAS